MADKSLCKIDGCGKRARACGWCSAHYYRWRTHGDPTGGGSAHGEAYRYFREVVLTYEGDECLIWPFARGRLGYAYLYEAGRLRRVHRLVCEEENGSPLTPKHHAAHSCGNGHLGCVTRKHLSWKTPSENQMDRVRHGTSNRGERCGSSKLTKSEVQEIRRLRGLMTHREISQRFGVSQSNISAIQCWKKWAWLE